MRPDETRQDHGRDEDRAVVLPGEIRYGEEGNEHHPRDAYPIVERHDRVNRVFRSRQRAVRHLISRQRSVPVLTLLQAVPTQMRATTALTTTGKPQMPSRDRDFPPRQGSATTAMPQASQRSDDAVFGGKDRSGYERSRSAWTNSRIRSARRWTPYLASRLETWNFAVRSDMCSLLPISLLDRFCIKSSTTSCSRLLMRTPAGAARGRCNSSSVESTKAERSGRGTQKPPAATSRSVRGR